MAKVNMMQLQEDPPPAKRTAPRNADYAAEVIAELKRDCRSKKARIRMAELAINMGNYTEEGRAVWRDYLATEGR